MGLGRHFRKKVELNDMKRRNEIEVRLKERYAKGEITLEQYEQMKKNLEKNV